MHEKLPSFCGKVVHSKARAAQYAVDAAQGGRTVHTTCCSHDETMNGPDIEVVDEVKALILNL